MRSTGSILLAAAMLVLTACSGGSTTTTTTPATPATGATPATSGAVSQATPAATRAAGSGGTAAAPPTAVAVTAASTATTAPAAAQTTSTPAAASASTPTGASTTTTGTTTPAGASATLGATTTPVGGAAAAGSTPARAATGTPAAQTAANGTLRLDIDPANTQAHFRAREQLANRSLPSDAIGTTSDVAGSISVGPAGIVAEVSKITVGLDSLATDQPRRDNFIKQNTLQTSTYPTAEFVARAVRGLDWPLPTTGQATFQLDGDLTIHGTTQPATWDVTATFSPQDVTGTATTNLTLDQFGMQKPRVASVLSIEDTIGLELDFRAVRAS